MSDEQQQQPPQSAEPQTPGQILRAAREFRGYQQAGVAERLCLSVQTIIDIENDDYKHFTAEIYLRGHIRSYAKVVDVDPAMVLKAYDDLGVEIESDPQVPVMLAQDVPISHRARRAKRKTLMWAGLGVLLVLIVMVVLWWQEQQRHMYYSQKMNVPIETKAMKETKPAAEITKMPKTEKTTEQKSTPHAVKQTKHKKRMRLSSRKSRAKKFVPDYLIRSVN